ncbi:MAG: thiol reductase thioredoxin [Candidatus Omnitrophica bacterium CG11_big_fil_rev_8_21_14_0_20_63_9]|nr:MAG: thiol reductase thioredoxin [Candidatus Omnitrophica bacterium CG11_big_fil_rev_8_21_14_0_20_63_9]
MIDFWAPWCGPCRFMTPVVDALAEIFAGRLTIGKVNIDRHPALAAPYGVTNIPTLKLFIGREVVKTWVGAHDQEQLVREITKTLRSQAAK